MKIIECPRDAMQGLKEFISTEDKISYINQLLKVGFDTLDVGSFVSSKSVPQMKDSAQVIKALDLSNSSSKLLAIIANKRGALDACSFNEISYLGFPLSVSEEFQKRNTNKTITQSFFLLEEIQELAFKNNKQVVVYLSMAFGNPYQEYWHPDLVSSLLEKVYQLNIKIVALSDTIGVSSTKNIENLFKILVKEYPDIEFGAHFHTRPDQWKEKISAAYLNGCCRFDVAIQGFGGCPMAQDKLVGNMPTEKLISYFQEKSIDLKLNMLAFEKALLISSSIFKK